MARSRRPTFSCTTARTSWTALRNTAETGWFVGVSTYPFRLSGCPIWLESLVNFASKDTYDDDFRFIPKGNLFTSLVHDITIVGQESSVADTEITVGELGVRIPDHAHALVARDPPPPMKTYYTTVLGVFYPDGG